MAGLKQAIARAGGVSGASRLGLGLQKALRMPFVRAINYHDVPSADSDRFEAQLEFYSRHFVPVGLGDLLALAAGNWPHDRPGLLISFDDGLASHAQVAAPLLEKHGFVGWFMVPTGFIDTPPPQQRDWAAAHSIHARDEPGPDGRVALSWDEVRRLAGRHVIGCHTVGHTRFRSELSPADFQHETQDARRRLEEELGESVEVFAWVGGEESSYCQGGADAIRKAGFRVGLMTNNAIFRPGGDLLQVQRTNIEARYSSDLMKLHFSGLYDVLYAPKRRRVNAMTRGA